MSEVSFEVLAQRFPSEVVNPFGEVLVIPSRLFERGWEKALEAQGHRVFAGDYNGEAAFLVRVDRAEPRNVAYATASSEVLRKTKSKPDRWKRWTAEEVRRLKGMLQQGLEVDRIAQTLGRSVHSVERKIHRLKRKGKLQLAGSEPAVTPNPVIDDHVVKELLQAASELYPKHRHATRFLLLKASSLIEQGK